MSLEKLKMKPPQPQIKTTNPDAFLKMIQTQAHNKSYDLAMGLSSQFVVALTKAGKITTIEEASKKLLEGNALIQPELEKQFVALSLLELEASLPTNGPTN